MTEIWRAIPGFDGYEASDQGRIRSWRSYARELPHVLKQGSYNGYPTVNLRMRTKRVHRIVALTFLGPRPEGLQIRHLDGDKCNNSVGNLAYGTPRENVLDTVRHGNHNMARKEHCPAGHPYNAENTTRRPGTPYRRCRQCQRERSARRRAAARVAPA